jgi:hypothetical protein
VIWICSRFQIRASSATWESLALLRKPGRSPSAPHSRVFSAVGLPQLVEAEGVGGDVTVINPIVADNLVQQPVHQGDVGAW